jgi:hypothetical protein
LFVIAIKSQNIILRIVQEKKEEKRENNDLERKKNLIELERKITIEIKSKRTIYMINSRKKMKETDGMLSFNVLLQKNL